MVGWEGAVMDGWSVDAVVDGWVGGWLRRCGGLMSRWMR